MPDETTSNALRTSLPRSQKTEIFISGMLLGALIGGGIVFLYAPLKGSNTRESIREGTRTAGEAIGETLTDLKEIVTTLSLGVSEIVKGIKNFGKECEGE